MKIAQLNTLYSSLPQCKAFVRALDDKSVKSIHLKGMLASSASVFFASLTRHKAVTAVFVLQDSDEAGYFYNDLTQMLGGDNTLFFPSSYRRAVKYGQRDNANEILRTEVLSRLAGIKEGRKDKEPLYVVTSPEALCELVVSREQFDDNTLHLSVGSTFELAELCRKLRSLGFEEVDYVYEPGQFALRGSILDIFSYSCELPFRVDFFGDEVDSIRTFDVQDQLSKDTRDDIVIVPEFTSRAENRQPFTSLLPDDTLLVVKDLSHMLAVIDSIYADGFSRQAVTARMEGVGKQQQAEIMKEMSKEHTLVDGTTFRESIDRLRTVETGHSCSGTPHCTIAFDITPQPLFHKNFDIMAQTLCEYMRQGYSLYILADSEKQTQRLHDIFESEEMRHTAAQHNDGMPTVISFTPVDHTLHEGFADNSLRACFFTDHQIFDRFHRYNLKSDTARKGKMALTMKELQEMQPGDYVVHIDFGIGRFGGLVRVPEGNSYKEMIRIYYQRGDIVDVSIHALYKISKYRRSDTGEPPRLSTLGTGAWERMKERTKTKIKDIARDLIKIYAARRHEKGFSFSADTYMQHELEASFLYEDTPDQSKATRDVKNDMESARPMDRLVCGDVGFGKTEVAIRAAFKAACDSKQVAVLVPTTVLALQHYHTFRDRLKDMPVRVDYLSRARTSKATKELTADLKAGKIDILIGTHKIIGKTVEWHDLGLLIIDEEQKFGVATKERLRKLKTNVDTLTMSATPIPRTLQFSLMGARDMSIIRTPPPNRHPVQTELAVYGHEIIADAVNFEMSRGGQVFFISDRINSLQPIASLIGKYVPDARVAIGHGQMSPEELEKILIGFVNHDYDVLVSTTIVENGIDIANANTIIINDAHRFGLSDLHQMRGRVGRSNRKAFCYLLAPPKSVLPDDARRRLEALESFSGLGSGFNIAMQDLDIRGAGNMLGAEQSGFIEELGYETYQKILTQAVTELKNDEFDELYAEDIKAGKDISGDAFVEDCALESDLAMYFHDSYVPGSAERMLLYRELDNIEDDSQLALYRQRLADRFGQLPHEGEELLQVVPLRRIGKSLGCEKITLKQGRMQLQLVSNAASAFYRSNTFDKLLRYIAANARRCDIRETKGKRLMVIANVKSVEQAVGILRDIRNC